MTSPERLNALILATRYVSRYGIPGDVVECGVWRGGSMQAVALTLLAATENTRDLYLFDTYEGMPPPGEEDKRRDGASAADLLKTAHRGAGIWAVATLEDVRAGLEQIPYPTERIHFVKGLVQDTVPVQAPERIAILRLDTDWYASTRHELEHLFPLLQPGGILVIDDYGDWQGARQAVDEYFAACRLPYFMHRIDETGRLVVKR